MDIDGPDSAAAPQPRRILRAYMPARAMSGEYERPSLCSCPVVMSKPRAYGRHEFWSRCLVLLLRWAGLDPSTLCCIPGPFSRALLAAASPHPPEGWSSALQGRATAARVRHVG